MEIRAYSFFTPCRTLAASAALLLLAAASVPHVSAQGNLFVNGDFSLGNVDFQTEYTNNQVNPSPGQYAIGTNANTYSGAWASFGDHTTGTGNMLIADASTTSDTYVWQETLTGLVPGTTYTFTAYLATNNPGSPDPADIQLAEDGTLLGSALTLPTTAGQFVPLTTTFKATSPTGTFQVFDDNTDYAYNDFSLDDLSLAVPGSVPEPSTWAVMLAGASLLVLAQRLRRRSAV